MNQLRYHYTALVTGVYDGDSITVDIDLGLGVWLKAQKVRLYGINTPELRGDDREAGLVARDYARAAILDKEVFLKTYKDKTGKYGRWLGSVYYETEKGWKHLNDDLVKLGLAKEYIL